MPSPHKFQLPYENCAVPDCRTVPQTWARYCTKHAQRRQRDGHPAALSLRDVDLKRHRARIGQALAELESAPAVSTGVQN